MQHKVLKFINIFKIIFNSLNINAVLMYNFQ